MIKNFYYRVKKIRQDPQNKHDFTIYRKVPWYGTYLMLTLSTLQYGITLIFF
jgi:hypothetical protein